MRFKSFVGVLVAATLVLGGCTTQDKIIVSLDLIETAVAVAAAAHPSPATIAFLGIVTTAVPQAIAEEESADSQAVKATLIAGYFGAAVAASKLLSPEDQLAVAGIVAAITSLLVELQQQGVVQASTVKVVTLTASQKAKLLDIATRTSQLRKQLGF